MNKFKEWFYINGANMFCWFWIAFILVLAFGFKPI